MTVSTHSAPSDLLTVDLNVLAACPDPSGLLYQARCTCGWFATGYRTGAATTAHMYDHAAIHQQPHVTIATALIAGDRFTFVDNNRAHVFTVTQVHSSTPRTLELQVAPGRTFAVSAVQAVRVLQPGEDLPRHRCHHCGALPDTDCHTWCVDHPITTHQPGA